MTGSIGGSTDHEMVFKAKDKDLVFVDGLYLEPSIVALGLKDGTMSGTRADNWRSLGRTHATDQTRWQNYTARGLRVGWNHGKIVSPIGGVAAYALMAASGGTAVLYTLVGVASSILGGYTMGGLLAGAGGLAQRLGLGKERHIADDRVAEHKMWEELRCIRGFSLCRDKPAEAPNPDAAFAPQQGP